MMDVVAVKQRLNGRSGLSVVNFLEIFRIIVTDS